MRASHPDTEGGDHTDAHLEIKVSEHRLRLILRRNSTKSHSPPPRQVTGRSRHNILGTCAREAGIWAGRDVACPQNPDDRATLCPKITGACCHGAVCEEKCINECMDEGGDYLGHATTCDPNFCAGACCVPGIGCGDASKTG